MKYSPTIRKLPVNNKGKDYVVGDLHGCYRLLERLLGAVDFDKSRDRLFSVGDLIDRGPDSLRCLQLLEEPWFYAVRGNHECMMLEFFEPYIQNGKLDRLKDIAGTGFLDYGGDWIQSHYHARKKTMSAEFNRALSMILDIPFIWIVGDGVNRFHVIHAELIRPNYQSAASIVWLDSDIDSWLAERTIPAEVEDRLFWSRSLMRSGAHALDYAKIQPGLSRTFCGHTYEARPRQVLSHVCLDTGAFLSLDSFQDDDPEEYALTLFDVSDACWVSASYQREDVIWSDFSMRSSSHRFSAEYAL